MPAVILWANRSRAQLPRPHVIPRLDRRNIRTSSGASKRSHGCGNLPKGHCTYAHPGREPTEIVNHSRKTGACYTGHTKGADWLTRDEAGKEELDRDIYILFAINTATCCRMGVSCYRLETSRRGVAVIFHRTPATYARYLEPNRYFQAWVSWGVRRLPSSG